MKKILVSLILVLLLPVIVFASDDDAGYTYNSTFEGKQYKAVMPISILKNSKDFDLKNKDLPMSLNDIIEVAYTQLVKITKTKNGWDTYSITLNNWRKNRQKWFYAVSFEESDFSSMDHITVLVTIDGQLGINKEVSEKIIK